MLTLDELSKIGFGGYNVSVGVDQHHDALTHALRLGCNVIDTASTYTEGASEALVGRCLQEVKRDAFIITKAGYIQGQTIAVIEQLEKRGLPRDEVSNVAPGFLYSLHPMFLAYQIARSRERLGVDRLDGFLLHNPEHLFEGTPHVDREEFYNRIGQAFEFFEEQVTRGHIRYYGVSSNTLPQSTEHVNNVDLRRIITCARQISSDHHFKLIEFPFNLLEQEALEPHYGGTNLITLAHENDLVIFGNRPLNAKHGRGTIRLATYDDVFSKLDEERDSKLFFRCAELVRKQLRHLGRTEQPLDFAVFRMLSDRWMSLPGPETVSQVFTGQLYPFLERLYGGDIPSRSRAVFLCLHRQAQRYARRALSERARELRRRLVDEGRLLAGDERPLPLVVCECYLAAGLDHILVGLRSPRYVDDLRPLLLGPDQIQGPSRA